MWVLLLFSAEKIDLFYYNFKNENGLKLSMSAKHEIRILDISLS